MKRNSILRCFGAVLASCMMLSSPVYASEGSSFMYVEDAAGPASDAQFYENDAASVPGDSSENEAASVPEDSSGNETVELPRDSSEDETSDVPSEFSGFEAAGLPEELVGSSWYYDRDLGVKYYFSCSDQDDYKCYSYTSEQSGTYHVDITQTRGRMIVTVYYSEDGVSLTLTDAWTGYYDGNDFHVYLQMQSGTKYVFCLRPDSERKETGRFRIRKTAKEIASATATPISNTYLAVGNANDGAWRVNEDGTTDYNVWEFDQNRLRELYEINVTFTDNTVYSWTYAKDGAEIGTTKYSVCAYQDTEGWTVGTKAYCTLWICDTIEPIRVQIPYLWFKDVQDSTHPFYTAIYWAASNGITKGYEDNTFRIDSGCTRSEAIMFLWRFMGKPAPNYTSKSPFSDVPVNHAHYKAILWASQKGITKGYSDGTFGIDRTCTRGQIMMFLWRAMGKPEPKETTKSPFSDVSMKHAYYKAICWGAQKSITKGFPDGTFGINQECTRGQIVTFLYRAK